MNKTIECTGKTIDEAIENALAQLGVERDEVSVEVLEKAKTGFLGIGGAPAKVAVTYDEPCAGGGESNLEGFLDGLLKRMGATAEITVENKDDGNIAVELVGENMGVLIGRRGETLDAIQHIANLVVNRGDGNHARVTVDTENYRKKREETLEALAKKVASQVIKYKRNKALEPMNAYERHVIHAALQGMENISTGSTGLEPNRRVIISYSGSDAASYNRRPYHKPTERV